MNPTSRPILLSDYAQPRRRKLIDGTSKTIFDGPEPGTYVLYFKDDITLEGETETISGKGILNNRISELLLSRLNDLGIETHFIRTLNMREQLVRATETLPFFLTLHNVASDNFAKRLGLEDGTILSKPIPEFSLRSRDLGDPIVAAEHLTALGWSRFEEIDEILLTAQRINDFLSGQFLALNMRLISFSLQFGRFYTSDLMDSQILITDELSPETINVLDTLSGRRLDQQGIEHYPESATEIYQEIARRLGVLGLDNADGLFASSSADAHLQQRFSNKQAFKQRKNPHGHNSL
jgi:phosphoribosylaminoimidazole-succinocarboxamide synthase